MLVVAEAAPVSPFREDTSESLFASMTEGGVAKIVAEGDGLGQVLVEVEGAGYGARDLHHLEGVGQAGAEVVAVGRDEDLGLVHEAAESLGVDNPITVTLELVADAIRRLGLWSTGAFFAGPGHRAEILRGRFGVRGAHA